MTGEMIALVYRYKNDYKLSKSYFDTVRIQIERMLKNNPDNLYLHRALSFSYAILDKKNSAIFEMDKGWISQGVNDYVLGENIYKPLNMLKMYIITGDYENALKQIELSLSNQTGLSINKLKLDPLYDPLRKLPGYKTIIDKYSKEFID